MNENPRMWKRLKRLTESEPVEPKQVGVDPRFVLSSHYELVMPGIYYADPETGTKAWSEPALVLLVSVDHPDRLSGQGHVLYYGLSRSFFNPGPDPSAGDRAKLMATALPLFKEDIERIGSSDVPDSLPKTRFV